MHVDLTGHNSITSWHALRAAGITPARIRAELAARRWRRWGYAIALHNGALLPQERWHVARIHAGRGALITGFTAAEACGLSGWDRPVIELLCKPGTRGARGCPIPSRRFYARKLSPIRRYRRSAVQILPQALFVATGSLDSPRSACGLLAASVQQRLVTAARLRSELKERPNTRHRRLLGLALADIEQGADALSEIDFTKLCRHYRLPDPDHQTVRREAGGRRRYLDATWRRPDGRLIAAEIDGALHLAQKRWWDDQLRQNELLLSGVLVLRFPSAVVRAEPDVVAGQLARALGTRPRLRGTLR